MELIKSRNNKYIVELAKLKEKKQRNKEKLFLIEGEHLIEEAYKAGVLKTVLFIDPKYMLEGVRNIQTTASVIEKLAFTKTPQHIIGVCSYLEPKEKELDFVLLLDNLQDPGNVGTLIRSSLGFNVDKVYLSEESVDLYNDKLIRSTQGAIFSIDIEVTNLKTTIKNLKEASFKVYGTDVDQGTTLSSIKEFGKTAVILGNEGSGIREEISKLVDQNIYIETTNLIESLNVSVAGSIILHYINKNKPEQ